MSNRQHSTWPVGEPPSPVFGESERAAVLASFDAASLEADPELDRIVKFAAKLCDVPFALVNLVGTETQSFLAREGLESAGSPTVPTSFCVHTMKAAGHTVVPNAPDDPRFAANSFVTGAPHIRFYAGHPLVSLEGAPLGALCVLDTDPREDGLSELQKEGLSVLAQAAMRRLESYRAERAASTRASESARAMREIADMVPGVVWSADGEGRFDYFSSRWELTTGAAKPASTADWGQLVHADDSERTLAAWRKSFAEGQPFECEYRLRQADGNWRWTLARALPVHDQQGKLVRWYGTLTDIDEGHRRSENRDLLARELSHRIKNIFAVLAGLVSLRARQAPEAAGFAKELTDTIRALGRAHDFVRPMEGIKGDNLRGLLKELMAPYAVGEGRVDIVGDDCPIGPRAATPLALTFHELATNSAKYGALSADDGAVAITIHCPDHAAHAQIGWRETGGPATSDPEEEGFGSRLMRSSIEGQLGGTMTRRFEHGGLEIDISIPLAAIKS